MTLSPIMRGRQINVPWGVETFFPSSSMFEQDKSETESTSESMSPVELILTLTTVLWLL